LSGLLLRRAHAILTGMAGADARTAATDIRVRDGVITEMGRGLAPLPGERVLDATGCVTYPGWVNTHHHLFQSLLKGIPAGLDLTLTPWLRAVPYAYRGGFDELTLRLAARVGLVELLLSGCSTVADHHYLYYPGMGYDATQALFEEAGKLGLRFMLLRGGATKTRDADADAPAHLRTEKLDDLLASVARDVARWHRCGPRTMTRMAMAPTNLPATLHAHEAREVARAARAMGVPLHSHMSESVAYQEICAQVHGCLPLEYAQRHEWVGPDVWYAHLVHLAPAEREILVRSGTGMSHCPQSNARLASPNFDTPRDVSA